MEQDQAQQSPGWAGVGRCGVPPGCPGLLPSAGAKQVAAAALSSGDRLWYRVCAYFSWPSTPLLRGPSGGCGAVVSQQHLASQPPRRGVLAVSWATGVTASLGANSPVLLSQQILLLEGIKAVVNEKYLEQYLPACEH